MLTPWYKDYSQGVNTWSGGILGTWAFGTLPRGSQKIGITLLEGGLPQTTGESDASAFRFRAGPSRVRGTPRGNRGGWRDQSLEEIMNYLPFDSGALFIPACERWKKDAAVAPLPEYLGDMLRIHTIAPDGRSLTSILRYFGLSPDGLSQDRLFDKIGDIQLQVFEEMLALTGEEYRVDWSRRDRAFCLWYRDRDHRRDATRDLLFVRNHTKPLFEGAEIRNSPVHGFGLFALREWFAGEVPCNRLDGQVLSHDEYEQLQLRMAPALGRMRHFFFMEWNALPGDMLLARPFRTYYSFINHSPEPNLKVASDDGFLSLVVTRNIRKDEEFTLDYRLEPLPRGYFDKPYSGYLNPVDL
jgi:hypothetical protein